MSTDDPNQLPPFKHTNIQQPQDILVDLKRLLRQQEDRLDRLAQAVKSVDDHLDTLSMALRWHEYMLPLLVGVLIGAFIGWSI